MTIRGSLDEALLPDFLQLLSLGRKSGRLAVSDPPHLGYIFLEGGRIVSATLVNRPDRLGDILVKNGEVTAAQLDEAIRIQGRNRDQRVGSILVQEGMITPAVLERYVRRQIEEAIYYLLTWQRGEVVFERGIAPDSDEILVSVDPDRILLEGARRTDEWTVIEQEIPSLDAVFVLDAHKYAAAELPVSDELRRIVALLDGTRNANQIIDDTGLSPFEVGKVLYDLVTSGCAQPKRRTSGETSRPNGAGASPTAHLDDAQLNRYLAHEGEFADEASRRRAAQHIVDCRVCTLGLSRTNQRRTGAGQARPGVEAATVAPAAPPAPPRPSSRVPPGELTPHLREVEMGRYVRREGEFAREENRREAARHVAVCPECAARIHALAAESREVPTGSSRPSVSEQTTVTAPAIVARPDHLETNALRQYAAREGEFADKDRRRAAGLHIADCRACAERLKALDRQRRSVTGVAVVPDPAGSEPTQPVNVPGGLRPTVASLRPPVDRADDTVPAVPAAGPAPRPSDVGTSGVPADVPAALGEAHLNYARLRAYAERTSEFEDDELRRYARRHIMNCEECTAALRRVRRDLREAGGVSARRANVERRNRSDRRAGADRRLGNRRTGVERRGRDQPRHPERRVMLRRVQGDRRVADRRSFSRRTTPEVVTDVVGAGSAPRPPAAVSPGGSRAPTLPPVRETTPSVRPDPVPAPRAGAPAPPAAASPPTPVRKTGPAPVAESPTPASPSSAPAGASRSSGPADALPGRPAQAASTPAASASTASARSSGRPKKLEEIVGEPIPRPPAAPRHPPRVVTPLPLPAVPPRRTGPWARIAAVIAVTALAGSLGWFGRSVFEPGRGDGTAVLPSAGGPQTASLSGTLPADSGPAPALPDSAVPEPADPVTVVAAVPPPQPEPVMEPAAVRAPPERSVSPRPDPTAVPPPPVGSTPRVPSAPPAAPTTPPRPVPTTSTLVGVVLDPAGGPVPDATVRLDDRNVAVRTDAAGLYRMENLAPGAAVVTVERSGYQPARRDVGLTAGDTALVDLMLRPVPRPRAVQPDDELASGQWAAADPEAARRVLETDVPTVADLWIESIMVSTGRRPRVRVAQLTESGDRVALVISRPRPQEPVGPPRVTALRVIAGTDAYPVTTGTASFGSLLITAKTTLPADSLQAMLGRLGTGTEPPSGR